LFNIEGALQPCQYKNIGRLSFIPEKYTTGEFGLFLFEPKPCPSALAFPSVYLKIFKKAWQ